MTANQFDSAQLACQWPDIKQGVDLYMVVGNPIAHSKSPWIHAQFAQSTHQAMQYERLCPAIDAFKKTLQWAHSQGLKGCNVTVPFKFEAFSAVQVPTQRATLAQACNTLWWHDGLLHGDNTDGEGLVRDITVNAGVSLAHKRILLLGAGGAAAGVMAALIAQSPAQLCVANRSADKAHALVSRHQAMAKHHAVELTASTLDAVDAAHDVVINATASSLAGAAVPISGNTLAQGALAYDMMYGPAAQPFLNWAAQHHAIGRSGAGMLVEQAAVAFELWRGIKPDTTAILRQLLAH